jgi:hypothetical protein
MTRAARLIRALIAHVVSTATMDRHVRLAVSFATAVLCLLAVATACAVRGGILGRIVFAVATVCYAATFFEMSELASMVPPAIAAWLPTVGLAVVAAALLRVRPVTPST